MTPARRLETAFMISQMTRDLFRHRLRRRFPGLTEDELHALYLRRLARCQNDNY